MLTNFVCSNCRKRLDRTWIKCPRCQGTKIVEVSAASLQPRLPPERERKAAHEQTYEAIKRDHGKAVADRFWNSKKRDF